MRLGAHSLSITTPWEENRSLSITLRPGEDHTEEIICPAEPLPEADLKFSIDWPEDLQDKKLWAICQFGIESRIIDKSYWSGANRGNVVISPKSELVTFSRIQKQSSRTPYSVSRIESYLKRIAESPITSPVEKQSPSNLRSRSSGNLLMTLHRTLGSMTAQGISAEFSPQLTWTGNRATLTSLDVGLLPEGVSRSNEIRLIYAAHYPDEVRIIGSRGFRSFSGSSSTSFSDSLEEWPAEERAFVLEPGRVNEWKIVPPEWLIQRIRLNLRVADAIKAQQQASNK